MAGSLTWLGHPAFRFDAPAADALRGLPPAGIELVAPAPGETVEL